MAETRAIKRIVKVLEQIKIQVTAINDNTRICDIKTCLTLLNDEWNDFQNLEKTVKGKFDDANLELIEKIENYHFELKQKLVRWDKLHEENIANQGNCTMDDLVLNQTNFLHEISTLNRRESDVRLPRVNIPIFSGKYSEFPSFRDLFEASVHNNNNISKVHKLQYLKGLLKGEAFSLINHLSVTDANYDEAWDKVKARYDKRKHVVHSLLKQFLDQPNLPQCCSKSLRRLSDVSDEVIRGLKVLGEQAESRDPWLVYILVNKLDSDSKEAWAHDTAEIDFPSLKQFFGFLNKRSDALESLDSMQRAKVTAPKKVTSLVSQPFQFSCPLCSGDHYLGKCDKFLEFPVSIRKQFVAEKKLCFNCLSSTHQATVCRSKFTCKICRRRHNMTLHPEPENSEVNANTSQNIPLDDETESTSYNVLMKTKLLSDQVQAILPTAAIIINDQYGRPHRCRVLLDSGSQSSFVSEDCVQRLRLQRSRANVKITGIAAGSISSNGRTVIIMRSLHDQTKEIEINALIVAKLPAKIPGYNINIGDIQFKNSMQLADPDFHKAAPIDVLIGADKFFAIMESEQQQIGPTILQKTIFGWVVSGQPKSSENLSLSSYTSLNVQIDIDIDKSLRQFWEIEETPQISQHSPEDEECEAFYNATTRRQRDGRYIVQLPFRKTAPKLGNSLMMATKRFLTIERKLSKDEDLKNKYTKQMQEYVQMGHMVEIPHSEQDVSNDKVFYLPHHAVVKNSSDTTNLRVVYDGSSKTTSGVSLNDILMVGPSIQPTLWVTLMRFRRNRIAITADIEKMYRQVIVSPNNSNFQRILWRESSNQRIRHYRLTRVTFGLACSAYLAIRTLQQLARDNGDECILQHVLNDFYVDDFLSGAETLQDAIKLKENITTILRQGGFPLRKWRSNVKNLCDEFNEITTSNLNRTANSAITVLGLHWHPFDDTFTFKVNPEQDGTVTKRKIISEASKVFDPLGFLAPSIILLKILFQKMWLLKLDWDDKLPDHFEKEYKKVREEFKYFEQIKIPRFTNQYKGFQIHGFADASEVAYSAVIYIRSINEAGEIFINLLTSKTKVAPIKKISLPRLELCAAHLLAKLMYVLKETISTATKYYAWTDSSIVLAWLSAYPARWKTFVANRTSEILDTFPRQHWAHVKSADNPADYGSRGIFPQRLLHLGQWWYGPEWLKQPEDRWPITNSEEELCKTVIDKELSKVNLRRYVFQTAIEDDWLGTIFERKSRLAKIFRIVAYVRRYIANLRCKNLKYRVNCELKAKEIEEARTQCILWAQNSQFSEDIANLRKHKMVRNNSKMLSLAPFVDTMGVLRVGGRLFNADCDYENKHPVILLADHIFTERIIWETHFENLHAGPTLTNNLIRQKYWIINGRTKIRSLLKTCVVCVKYAHKTSSQLMGNLPLERVTPTRPFANCGIDFAGPLYFASRKGRGGTNPTKGYLCIFVCLSVKAIHIEPVSDLTSEAFLAALKRFTARRGIPHKIYTDNGTNFIGAKRILNDACKLIQKINQNYVISEFLSNNGIDWQFIPPSSPHFGGLWESAVKSVKTHLLKSVHNVNLTFEEMATLLCQIENILNSRPICTTSVDDNYEVLTPAHFLIGTSAGSIPETEVAAVTDSSLSRWHRIQARIQRFWRKYHTDYLNNLQQRHKWHKTEENLQINDVVLIKEDNTPVCKWPLGRIIQVHPGDDKLIRVVTIKTASTTIKRPIVKLCKLPVG